MIQNYDLGKYGMKVVLQLELMITCSSHLKRCKDVLTVFYDTIMPIFGCFGAYVMVPVKQLHFLMKGISRTF